MSDEERRKKEENNKKGEKVPKYNENGRSFISATHNLFYKQTARPETAGLSSVPYRAIRSSSAPKGNGFSYVFFYFLQILPSAHYPWNEWEKRPG
jgi:hypothetical protein